MDELPIQALPGFAHPHKLVYLLFYLADLLGQTGLTSGPQSVAPWWQQILIH